MPVKFDFDKIVYKKPRPRRTAPMGRFVGLDTEAYTTGRAFLICTSEGDVIDPASLPSALFAPHLLGCEFVVYNLQYDSGALLRHLPIPKLKTLWRTGECQHKRYRYTYIEHKFLQIKYRNMVIRVWDIAQYYEMSLDNAAKKYLNSPGKLDMETKSFTPAYVKRHREKLIKYCIQDCKLTAELAEFFRKKLAEFGIECTRLFSSASLSHDYFSARGAIVNVWPYWTQTPDLLRAACEAYQGGKFEITARGSFTGIEYDIVSAYPYEISRLVDLRFSKTEHNRAYDPDATYSFLRVDIHNKTNIPLPHGVKVKNVQIFPLGEFPATLTKAEYEYMTLHGIDITVRDAWHIYADPDILPYYDRVQELYKMKDFYKNRDAALYAVSKKMLNGFYGKFLQLVDKNDDVLRAGAAWNPIYAAIITANTRLKVTEYQRRFPRECIAVHTDSLMMLNPLPETELSNDLGGLKREVDGPGILIMCGMYDLADKTKYRGFEFGRKTTWRELLSENRNAHSIDYPQRRVISWTQAMAWDTPEKINVFEDFTKHIDLNADTKRVWPSRVTGNDLLTRLDYSTPRLYIQPKG